MSSQSVVLASDHAGFALKQALVKHLGQRGVRVVDLGPATADRCDYPDYAAKLARQIVAGEAEFGVLVCGSGIGMSIAANKVNGARAAVVSTALNARLARAHNNANIVCVGSRTTGPSMAEAIVDAFLETPFEGGRHADRLVKLHGLEAH